MSFTVSSQNDSLICFTKDQVKVFLVTKVELNNCIEQYNTVRADLQAITEQNSDLTANLSKQKRKARRNRIWGLSSTGIAALLLAVILAK